MLLIGIIREEKEPQDNRVPLTPEQASYITNNIEYLEVVVQSSEHRCFTDDEYRAWGIKVLPDVSHCEILIGVKEVPIDSLIPEKKYFFFSHTIKKQPYNKNLLKAILKKKIQLIDWECLTDIRGNRIIAFGKWAGIVGAHNAILTYGSKTDKFSLMEARNLKTYEKMLAYYKDIHLPPMRVLITGTGRVAHGADEALTAMKFAKITVDQYLSGEKPKRPEFIQLPINRFYKRKKDGKFIKDDFFQNPENYDIQFKEFLSTTDILINCIYWDPKAPVFFTQEQMQEKSFKIKTIGDITCDIKGSIPSTIRPSTIDDKFYGYDPRSGTEVPFGSSHAIAVMAIDNLPNELPRDASQEFGEQFIEHILPCIGMAKSDILENASITKDGELGDKFAYLKDYVS